MASLEGPHRRHYDQETFIHEEIEAHGWAMSEDEELRTQSASGQRLYAVVPLDHQA